MSTKFGWCLPGIEQHGDCIRKIDWNGGVLCDCACHGVDSEVLCQTDTKDDDISLRESKSSVITVPKNLETDETEQ